MLSNISKWFKRKFSKMSVGQIIVFTIAFILFAMYALTIIYTIGWSLIASLKERTLLNTDPFGLPKFSELNFQNYVYAFNEMNVEGCNLLMMLLNSIWYSVGGTFVSIACSTCMAYVVSKYKFWGRKILYTVAIVIMTLPIMGTLPASYRLIYALGLNSSPLILLTFTNGFGMNFVILYGFFCNVSWSYAEAGLIDGAGDFTIFFKIMLPQAMPAILSLFIIAFIGVWNDYQGPLLYMPEMPTLATGIYIFKARTSTSGNFHILFAALNLVMLPVLALFIAFQETIMTNTAVGGLKG